MELSAKAPLLSWRGAILALLLAVPLCWPMFVTGGIYTFPDTRAYLAGGEFIWGQAGEWLEQLGPEKTGVASDRIGAAQDTVSSRLANVASADDSGPLVIRSIVYSFFSYSMFALGGPLLLAVSQGALTVLAVFAFIGPAEDRRASVLLSGAVLVGLLTSLPWFTVYMMPDIFAAVVLLHGALLIRRFDYLTRSQQIAMTLIASFAVASHYGNPPLAFGLFSAAAAWRLIARRWNTAALVGALVPVLLSPLANLTISATVLESPSVAPLRLPVLLARSLEDGPAFWYLEQACPEADFAICIFFEEDAPESVSEFLWSEAGIEGASRETVARIIDEELPVLTRAFLAYPVEQATSLLRNAALQLTRFRLDGLRVASGLNADFRPIELETMTTDRALRRVADHMIVAATLASGLVFALGLVSGHARRDEIEIAAMLVLGLVMNALVFGGLSYPVDRYQARIIWLLPAFAAIFLARRPGSGAPLPSSRSCG